jgi:hypothetical protein
MGKFDRDRFFEALCRLRAVYRLGSDDDVTSVMSVDDAIAYACALLAEREEPAEQVTLDELRSAN